MSDLDRLDRAVDRAADNQGKVEARTMHLFIADLRAGAGRERRIAAAFGLPWTWRVQERGGRLVAFGPALGCGHRTVSTIVRDGDVLSAAARLVGAIAHHKDGI